MTRTVVAVTTHPRVSGLFVIHTDECDHGILFSGPFPEAPKKGDLVECQACYFARGHMPR